MTVFFLAVFILGLLIAVRVMFFGIERPARRATAANAPDRPRFSYAALAALAVVTGMVGYLLERRGASSGTALAIGAATGLVAAALAAWGAAAWARVVPEHDVDDPRYVLQGHLARVSAAITAEQEGEITFELGAERRTARARAIDASSVGVGTEVVIERIDDDVAYVEPWQQVEKRL